VKIGITLRMLEALRRIGRAPRGRRREDRIWRLVPAGIHALTLDKLVQEDLVEIRRLYRRGEAAIPRARITPIGWQVRQAFVLGRSKRFR
jgi:hypothetical protein